MDCHQRSKCPEISLIGCVYQSDNSALCRLMKANNAMFSEKGRRVNNVALATTLHDPEGRLYSQIVRVLPALRNMFADLVVCASADTSEQCLIEFKMAGARVYQEPAQPTSSVGRGIGRARRDALSLTLQLETKFVLYCDADRVLHWGEYYPTELNDVVSKLVDYDLLVLGRTSRAFDSHPRPQRDTEAIVNFVFGQVSGFAWDVTAAARGLSRRAAYAIVHDCVDDEISNDVTWPLLIHSLNDFTQGYLEAEGLEFETADRFKDEVVQSGGMKHWLAQVDANPREWERRLELARIEILALTTPCDGQDKHLGVVVRG